MAAGAGGRALSPDSPDPAASPEELLLAGERRRAVRRSLARLHRDQRRSILHRYYVAGEVPAGLSTTTVRTRLHRGLERLRELTRGLRALVPPVRLGHWLALAANPAAVGVLLLAQQAPVVPPPPAPAPAPVHARPAARKAPAPPPVTPAPPAAVAPPSRPHAIPAPAATPVRYDFEDDEVTGELENPNGIRVLGQNKAEAPIA